MMRHVVLVTWQDGVTETELEAVAEGLSSLPSQIPEIIAYDFGPDLGLSGGAYDFVIVADFEDEDAWRRYLEHPAHVVVAVELIRPIVERTDRVQYTI